MTSTTGYWFGMGAGDTASRGFDLFGSDASQLWFRGRAANTWNQVITANNAHTLNGVITHAANIAMANNTIVNPSFKGYTEFVSNVTVSTTTTTLDLSTANFFNCTMSSNTTFTFSNAPAGKMVSFTIIAAQDATGGRTITWPTGTKFSGGASPPQTTTANAIDVWTLLTYNGGSTWINSLAIKGAA
jgi:hypothetical protein